jgi:hypothetical protein
MAIDLKSARAAPALSIRQPWAELIVRGYKDVEVRTWCDPYRGPIWLHTGSKLDEVAFEYFQMGAVFTGGLVGIAELTGIRPLTRDLYESWRDRHRDFAPFPSRRDLYGWILSDVKRLRHPRKCKGSLGLFQVETSEITDDEIERLITNPRLAPDN